MTGKLKIDMKRAMKYAWIATNTSLGLALVVLYPDYSSTNNEAIVLVTLLLSFPSSIPAALLAAYFLDGYPPIVDPPFDHLIICVVAFIAGYIQWFWWIPRFVKDKEVITLHLTSPGSETRPVTATITTRRRKSYQSKLPLAPFDKRGHSPLERAIGIKRS